MYKGTFAYAEMMKPKSETPRVDEVGDCLPKYSPRFALEIEQLAKQLEKELAEEMNRVKSLNTIIQQLKHEKRKVLAEASVKTFKNAKNINLPIGRTAFDSLSNSEVMDRLREFGIGR